MLSPIYQKDGRCYNGQVSPGSMELQKEIEAYRHLLCCPGCGGELSRELSCLCCGRHYPQPDEIPSFFLPSSRPEVDDAVTTRVRSFYEEHPFPDYEELEDVAGLIEKARRGVFARLLDEEIPFGCRVLDCGCGTGQLANFLAVAHRTVFGSDACLNSLRLARQFRQRHGLQRAFFLHMNLFRPCFPPGTFQVVICNGVLHHTPAPQTGFRILAELVKPGGYLVVGLYHRFGRLATDLRRFLFQLGGMRLAFLDPRLRRELAEERRRQVWFADQYRNPHERKFTISQVLPWLAANRLELIRTLPGTKLGSSLRETDSLFRAEPPASRLEMTLKEWALTLTGAAEGGFFIVIARKPPLPSR